MNKTTLIISLMMVAVLMVSGCTSEDDFSGGYGYGITFIKNAKPTIILDDANCYANRGLCICELSRSGETTMWHSESTWVPDVTNETCMNISNYDWCTWQPFECDCKSSEDFLLCRCKSGRHYFVNDWVKEDNTIEIIKKTEDMSRYG